MNTFTIELILKPSPEFTALLQPLLSVLQPATPQDVPSLSPPVITPPAAPAAAPVVATTERTYTLEELGRAGAQLLDAGKGAEAVALMGQFSVASISELKYEQYGAMATELRKLGAKI